jgi:hypothetical protein
MLYNVARNSFICFIFLIHWLIVIIYNIGCYFTKSITSFLIKNIESFEIMKIHKILWNLESLCNKFIKVLTMENSDCWKSFKSHEVNIISQNLLESSRLFLLKQSIKIPIQYTPLEFHDQQINFNILRNQRWY